MKISKIFIKNLHFESFMAISSDEQNRGLMFVKPPTPVMSFVYSNPQVVKFWMKNTPSSLDIVFACNGKITQIHEGEPYSLKSIGAEIKSDLVIEFPRGTVEKLNIKIGDNVGFIS